MDAAHQWWRGDVHGRVLLWEPRHCHLAVCGAHPKRAQGRKGYALRVRRVYAVSDRVSRRWHRVRLAEWRRFRSPRRQPDIHAKVRADAFKNSHISREFHKHPWRSIHAADQLRLDVRARWRDTFPRWTTCGAGATPSKVAPTCTVPHGTLHRRHAWTQLGRSTIQRYSQWYGYRHCHCCSLPCAMRERPRMRCNDVEECGMRGQGCGSVWGAGRCLLLPTRDYRTRG